MAITSEEVNVVPESIIQQKNQEPIDKVALKLILRLLEQQYKNAPLRYSEFGDLLPTFNMEKLKTVILKTKFAIEKSQKFIDLHATTIWTLAEEGYGKC